MAERFKRPVIPDALRNRVTERRRTPGLRRVIWARVTDKTHWLLVVELEQGAPAIRARGQARRPVPGQPTPRARRAASAHRAPSRCADRHRRRKPTAAPAPCAPRGWQSTHEGHSLDARDSTTADSREKMRANFLAQVRKCAVAPVDHHGATIVVASSSRPSASRIGRPLKRQHHAVGRNLAEQRVLQPAALVEPLPAWLCSVRAPRWRRRRTRPGRRRCRRPVPYARSGRSARSR